jgi:hypothetical protein
VSAPFNSQALAQMRVMGTALAVAAENIRRAFEEMGRAISRATSNLARRVHISRYGPRNLAGDDTWQTDLCAAWVHDACPSRFCGCTCHGGTVR